MVHGKMFEHSTERFRYTSDTVFDTFPWPQSPTLPAIRRVATASSALRAVRRRHMGESRTSLRILYRLTELPGKNPLNVAQEELDLAVREAYGMSLKEQPLAFLLGLNLQLAEREVAGQAVQGPGLPSVVNDPIPVISAARLEAPGGLHEV